MDTKSDIIYTKSYICIYMYQDLVSDLISTMIIWSLALCNQSSLSTQLLFVSPTLRIIIDHARTFDGCVKQALVLDSIPCSSWYPNIKHPNVHPGRVIMAMDQHRTVVVGQETERIYVANARSKSGFLIATCDKARWILWVEVNPIPMEFWVKHLGASCCRVSLAVLHVTLEFWVLLFSFALFISAKNWNKTHGEYW